MIHEQNSNPSEWTATDRLETLLLTIWQEVLGGPIDRHDNFFALGGNSIKAAMIMNRLQQQTQAILHPVSIFDAPSIFELAHYLEKNYPHIFPTSATQRVAPSCGPGTRLRETQIEQARQRLLYRYGEQTTIPQQAGEKNSGEENKRVIFVLSAPRSGSTLLRVMLGGHPKLFSPPELYLLSFATMQNRKRAFAGRLSFMKEGLVRAIMALKSCGPLEATAIAESLEAQAMPTKAVFQLLQSWIGDRLLVDKTPPYALNPAVLQRMEAEFANAFYIHLVRHPAAMIHSFVQARIDLAAGDALDGLDLSLEQKGELWWLISQQNICSFLERIPADRQQRVCFETLVQEPQPTMQTLCHALHLDFDPAMLNPYAEKQQRMTDGVHEMSRLVGDPKFHLHQGITAGVADSWQGNYDPAALCAATRAMAEHLGYDRVTANPLSEGNGGQDEREREIWEF